MPHATAATCSNVCRGHSQVDKQRGRAVGFYISFMQRKPIFIAVLLVRRVAVACRQDAHRVADISRRSLATAVGIDRVNRRR